VALPPASEPELLELLPDDDEDPELLELLPDDDEDPELLELLPDDEEDPELPELLPDDDDDPELLNDPELLEVLPDEGDPELLEPPPDDGNPLAPELLADDGPPSSDPGSPPPELEHPAPISRPRLAAKTRVVLCLMVGVGAGLPVHGSIISRASSETDERTPGACRRS
jgi:hypothetical protein